MTFKSLVVIYLIVWMGYGIYVLFAVISTAGQLNLRTIKGAKIGNAGPIGLSKSFYIKTFDKQDTSIKIIRNSSAITRVYTGFTLAKLLLPIKEINNSGIVTFYYLSKANDNTIVHFAANPGYQKASIIRLYIDVFSYIIHRLIFLHTLLFILFIFLKDIFKLIDKNPDNAQVSLVYNQSGLSPFISFAYILFFIFSIL